MIQQNTKPKELLKHSKITIFACCEKLLRNTATHLGLLCIQKKIQDMKQDLCLLALCFPTQPSQKDKKKKPVYF